MDAPSSAHPLMKRPIDGAQDLDRPRFLAPDDVREVLRAAGRLVLRAVFGPDFRAVFRAPLRPGTLAPFFRASLRPIAIACFRLVTLRPEPLLSVPFLVRDTADLTRLAAAFPYFAMLQPPNGYSRDSASRARGPMQVAFYSRQPTAVVVPEVRLEL